MKIVRGRRWPEVSLGFLFREGTFSS
jgi:hypothetical protein